MIAYACVPGGGSEPGVGWNRAVQAGRFAETWVICEGRECEAALTRYIEVNGPVAGVTFHFVPLSASEAALQRVPGCYYLAYNLWHRRAFCLAKALHATHEFDLSHLVNIVSFREPGYLWKLQIPFVWGPVGGTQNLSAAFLEVLNWHDAAKETLRTWLNRLQLRFGRRQKHVGRTAAALIAANSTIEHDLLRTWGVQSERQIEVGVTEVVEWPARLLENDGELHILWVGHVTPVKALRLLIAALAKLPRNLPWKLRVIGDGTELGVCKQQAIAAGIQQHIEWLGWQRRADVLPQYAWADVFVFTSLRDTTGTVVLEALSNGVPVVCLDHQGAGDVVTEECGIKVPVGSPSQVIDDLAAAIERIADDPEFRRQLASCALERAEEFHWSRQGDRMADIYRRVLAAAGSDAIPCEQAEVHAVAADVAEVPA
jgi:glycosyltransferase involved in cell wall biosynthesis